MLSLPFVQITLPPLTRNTDYPIARNTDCEMSCHNLDRSQSLFYFVPQENHRYVTTYSLTVIFKLARLVTININHPQTILKLDPKENIKQSYSSPRLVVHWTEELIVWLLLVENAMCQKQSLSFLHLLCSGMVGFGQLRF